MGDYARYWPYNNPPPNMKNMKIIEKSLLFSNGNI